ncbi:E2/UBC family protein [Burkholderia sp. 9120]|uniref:E2/UBC family protein n=1 Tax=Burkholderia sp. 9120 TaxID=1500897 RepID=UPI00055392FD|nr:E2/UBC family protein [Burkholderia sp. 9120]
MQLPAKDERFLNERGYNWVLVPDSAGTFCVLINDFDVSGGGFTPAKTQLMIRVPPQYPLTPLDMWYCDPPVRIAATGQFAPQSEVSESHVGKTWQRFSRHLPPGAWRPGIDGLRSFMGILTREMQGVGRGA